MKIRKTLLSLALSGVMVLGLMPGMTMTALAADNVSTYTLQIPSTLNVSAAGWNETSGLTAAVSSGDTFDSGKKLSVTAASANSWSLKSGDNSVGYNLATATGTYSNSATPASWEFTAAELNASGGTNKAMGIIVDDYSEKPAGTYQDTVTFTASVEDAAAADNPAPTTASIEDYTAGTFGWDGDGSAATGLPTINTFAANDKISILSAKNTNTQFTTSAGGASATFSGTATDDSKFYAVYPYTAGLTLSGDVISGVVIPTSQWNSGWNSDSEFSGWDPKAPIAYATTTGSSLTFHNACAILKVTITGSGTWAIFTISANEPLAGTFSLDTSTGTLTPTSGSTTVAVGTDFSYTNCFETQGGNKTAYIAIAPGTYTNFTLYLTNEDGGHNSKTKSGSVTFEAGKIYDLGSYNVEYFD